MQPQPSQAGRRAVGISCGLLVLFTVLWTAFCAGLMSLGALALDPVLAIFSAIAAVALAMPYLLAILWIDRNEREPPLLLASAFFWGAIVATMISAIFNDTFGLFAQAAVNDAMVARQLTASISAPFIEEIAKGSALIALYLMFRNHLDNVLDGVVYGALVGLGFAVFENFMYYVQTGNLGAAIGLVCIRGVITSAGTHACFTAIVGASIGLFRVWRSGPVRWVFPPLGLALAMFVHFAWNTFTQFFLTEDLLANLLFGLPMAVLVIQMPFVLLMIGVSFIALWHERVLIERYLATEDESVVQPGELSALIPARRRTLKAIRLVLTGDLGGWFVFRKRNARLVELAFEKWHMDAEASLGDAGAQVHASRVMELRRELKGLPAPPA
jgi:RsiW-degrading membrane proteinase PrsW (M82 family)